MMNQFTSKSLMSRLCLMSFILLCSVFTSETAFSRSWKSAFKEVEYDKKDETINFIIESYEYDLDPTVAYSFPLELELKYSENGSVFTSLLRTHIDFAGSADKIWAKVTYRSPNEVIYFPDCEISIKNKYQWVGMQMKPMKLFSPYGEITYNNTVIKVKWHLHDANKKSIKSVQIAGKWCEVTNGKQNIKSFSENFPVKIVGANQKAPKKSNNNLKATRLEESISVTGVKSGEIIKVYNADTRAEVRSVVAQDDVVNISLPKGHLYLIKVGQKSIKVAL